MRKLYHFHGGVHPPTHKSESAKTPIAQAGLPSRLVVPLHQHVGNSAKPSVQVGERVLKGQIFGMPEGSVSSAVHAPTSGIVTAIDMQVVAHPSGLPLDLQALRPGLRQSARQPALACAPAAAELG